MLKISSRVKNPYEEKLMKSIIEHKSGQIFTFFINIISIFTGLKIFLQHSGRRIAQLYAVGDQVHESNVGTVFAQFRHLK